MNVSEAINTRQSVRAFTDEAVDLATLRETLELAVQPVGILAAIPGGECRGLQFQLSSGWGHWPAQPEALSQGQATPRSIPSELRFVAAQAEFRPGAVDVGLAIAPAHASAHRVLDPDHAIPELLIALDNREL